MDFRDMTDKIIRQWPNPEAGSDSYQITREGDMTHIVVLEDGERGPVAEMPGYLAPRRHDFRVRIPEAKYDRRYIQPLEIDGQTHVEEVRLHLQVMDLHSNVLVGWKANEFGRPMKTFQELYNRVRGVYDVRDHIPRITPSDEIELMIWHDVGQWRSWLLCKNSHFQDHLPERAELFLHSLFGEVPSEIRQAFLSPERPYPFDRLPLEGELLERVAGYYTVIEQAEASLRTLQDQVTGAAMRRKKFSP